MAVRRVVFQHPEFPRKVTSPEFPSSIDVLSMALISLLFLLLKYLLTPLSLITFYTSSLWAFIAVFLNICLEYLAARSTARIQRTA